MKNSKIGIACGCRKLNYGSLLQSYALCESVKKMGYQCNFVWVKGNFFKHYNIRIQKVLGAGVNAIKHPILIPKITKSIYRILTKQSSDILSNNAVVYFDKFKKDYFDIKLYTYKELCSIKEYSAFICGSDQIWNTYDVWLDPIYFLDFTNSKIAYAPSLGTNSISKYNKKTIINYLKNFKYISVREKSGAHILSNLLERDIPFVLDPTFLLNKNEWIKKLELTKSSEEYCLVYFLDEPTDKAKSIINELRKEINIKALPLKFSCYKNNEIISAGPKEFLNLLYNAKFVITDSFHGTILSINFEKQFLTFPRNYNEGSDQSSRILDILELFKMSEFYINYDIECSNMLALLRNKIDYKIIEPIIDKEKNRSLNYLSDSIIYYLGEKE